MHAKRFSTSVVLLSLVSSTMTLLPTTTLAAAQTGPHAEFPPAMQAGASPSIHLDPPSRAAHATPRRYVSTQQAQAPSPHDRYTAYSHTWRDTGRPVTTDVYLEPHFHEKGGAWSEVDTTVRSRADAQQPLSAEDALRPVRFGNRASRIVELELDGGPVTISAPDLAVGAPQMDGKRVVYASVAPDTDLVYEVTAAGIKEELILKSAAAPQQFTFHVSDPGHQLGAAQAQRDGSVHFDAQVDGVVLGLAHPAAYTADPMTSSVPLGVDPSSAHMNIVASPHSGFDVTTSVSASWAKGKSYPIVLDPTVTFASNEANGSLFGTDGNYGPNCHPTGTSCTLQTAGDMAIGTYQHSGSSYYFEPLRSYWRFQLSSITPGSRIDNAVLNMYLVGCLGDPAFPTCAPQQAFNFEPHPLTAMLDIYTPYSTLAANTGGAFTTWGQGAYNFITKCSGCFWEQFGSLQGLVSGWVNNAATNYGMSVQMSSNYEANSSYGGDVWTDNGQYGQQYGNKPYLNITYDPVPNAPNNVAATPGNASARVTWQPPSPNNADAITSYTVTAYNSSNGVVSRQTVCSSCTSAQFTGLTNGATYTFGVYASNDIGSGPEARSNAVSPVSPPAVSKSVDNNPGTLLPGQLATFHVTVSDPESQAIPFTSVSDTLPGGFALATGPFASFSIFSSAGSYFSCAAPTCTIQGNTITYAPTGGLTLQPGDTVTINYQATAVDGGQGCFPEANQATAVNAYGSSQTSLAVTVCEGGLGFENYWDFVHRDLGSMGTASVNPADGNLVVQQTDFTPMQAHGRLGFVLRRTYNSEDTAIATLPGTMGSGWQLNVSQTDDIVGDGIGGSSLYLPTSQLTSLSPLAVTLIDRDGTRHVFQPNGLSTPIDTLSLDTVHNTEVTDVSGALGAVRPFVLKLENPTTTYTGTYNHICVDETFVPPPGVHMSLWRYFAVTAAPSGAPCTAVTGTSRIVIGYAGVTTDRIRYEFSVDGHLLDMRDAAGNELVYTYQSTSGTVTQPLPGVTSFGVLASIQEPASKRAYSFTLTNSSTFTVTDPAARTTVYKLDGAIPNAHLIEVDNPGGSVLHYAYGSSCDTAYGAPTNATANQMCSETDLLGKTTYFAYTSTSADGVSYPLLNRIAAITDRRESSTALAQRTMTTTFSYHDNATPRYVYADQAGHRERFMSIDTFGRVGEIDQGDTSNNYSRVTLRTWDGDVDPLTGRTTYCRQPDAQRDNDLCHVVRRALNDSETGQNNGVSTPDQNTSYQYDDEGMPLETHACPGAASSSPTSLPPCTGSLDTTAGYQAQYIEANSTPTVSVFTDSVHGYDSTKGYGADDSTTRSGGRLDSNTLYVVVDQLQSLPPRGNLSGATVSSYRTTYLPDDNTGASPNVSGGSICPGQTSNTGLVCEIDGPGFDSTGAVTATRYTYDADGQKVSMTTPKAIAEGGGSYTYVYYSDTDTALVGSSNPTVAGGWLKEVVDPIGHFVAYGYDAAGNVERTWNRNATSGNSQSSYPSPGPGGFTETLHASALSAAPWRYLLSSKDPFGNLTTYTVDADGNHLTTRSPRGNAAGNSTFDTTLTFDPYGDVLTSRLPSGDTTTNVVDAFGNRTQSTDPLGKITVDVFDTVNRLMRRYWTRGAYPTDPTLVPGGCDQAGQNAGDPAVFGSGSAAPMLCSNSSSYDGVDNPITSTDGNGQRTTVSFDAVHRETSRFVPRDTTVTPNRDRSRR